MSTLSDYCREAIMDAEGNELVITHDACPGCGERRIDWLVWNDDCSQVTCSTCGHKYDPAVPNA